ncbi:helix-turn-helix domain-containing protein [Nocardia crassostreae]|uniref:helix-turn-helix domain-containing protein n=1 Tax=Nocardia crassostreae TaxID=53428 RepID=UPI0012FB591E|nr:helix-turn-helix domain-containing protein [Nocardia crassostreae]
MTKGLQERFGRIVAMRREELGLSRPDVRVAGGPSVATMARIESPQGGTAPPSPATLRLLDAGLRWVEGSAARALHGGEPMKLDAQALLAGARAPSGREHDPLSFRVIELDIDVVDALIAAADSCFQLCDRTDLPVAAQDCARAAKEQLGVAIGRLAAAQATEVLERAGGPNNEIPKNIERLIGALLAAPPTATGIERENQQYRRWLARTATNLDPALEDRFVRRWQSKLNRIGLIEGENR